MEEREEQQQEQNTERAERIRSMASTSKSRMTVVEHVYHQKKDRSPTGTTSRFSRPLISAENPYVRSLGMLGYWVAVDTGWFGPLEVAVLILTNEKESTGSLVVAILEQTISILLPGESIRLLPEDCSVFQLYGDDDSVRCEICAIGR